MSWDVDFEFDDDGQEDEDEASEGRWAINSGMVREACFVPP